MQQHIQLFALKQMMMPSCAEVDIKVEMSTSLFTASLETVCVCGMYASGDVVFETFTTDTDDIICDIIYTLYL